ncbi:MAG: hypothetical protein KDD41_05705 [Flavobacteriales bacterium]|nr:hypothetical protein [Flavobacteriales bacterium]
MKRFILPFSILALLFVTACSGDVEIENTEETVEEFVDDPNAEQTAADTSSSGVYQEEVSEEPQSLQEAMQSANNEPEAEEGGMSFCDCVKRNKELQDIMMADGTSDEDFDKAMEEMEAMKTGECKIMFPDQSNIEEKQAHERKVRKCLGK